MQPTTTRRPLLTGLTAAIAIGALLAGCGSSTGKSATNTTSPSSSSSPGTGNVLKVGYLLDGSITDSDYNEQQYRNAEAAQSSIGSKISTDIKQNVPQGPQAAQTVKAMIASGDKLIFITTTGDETYLKSVAAANPGIRFENFESAITEPNYGAYNVNIGQGAYIGGMTMAGASKTGHLGVVASFPFPGILQQVNGLELGAQAVNPNATLKVIFVSSFFDPAKESQAAQALIASGVDAIADIQNDQAACVTAETDNVPCEAQTLLNGPSYAPKMFLSDFNYNWTPIFEKVISLTLAGQTIPQSIFYGWPEGATQIAEKGANWGTLVSTTAQSEIAAKETALQNGLKIFKGPIEDQSGNVKVPAGQTLSVSQILSLNWAVKGVIGSVSASG
ncbi:MAG: BMP family ABC transporter substrate-binding protein [Acidimicrobiales bacterium]